MIEVEKELHEMKTLSVLRKLYLYLADYHHLEFRTRLKGFAYVIIEIIKC